MYKLIIIAIIIFGVHIPMYGLLPEINTKLGRPTQEELTMTEYDPEPEAKAVVLFNRSENFVYYDTYGFTIKTKEIRRIKILDETETHLADIAIPYHSIDGKSRVSNISASSYNLVNGKVEKSSVDKSLIFHEEIAKNIFLCKFSIPKAVAGSVLEIQYEMESDIALDDWMIQQDIPVLRGEYELVMPEYFHFSVASVGYEHIRIDKHIENSSFSLDGTVVKCKATVVKAMVEQLPSIKKDDYLYSVFDYSTRLDFTLTGIQFPGSAYRPIADTWSDIFSDIRQLWETPLRFKNPYKEEIDNIDFSGCRNLTDSVDCYANFVASKIKWNGSISLTANDLKQVVSRRSGSNCDMNFVLLSILREKGIPCCGIAVCMRNNGPSYCKDNPSLGSFNAMIACYADNDGKLHYIDCSDDYRGTDVLPILMNSSLASNINNDIGIYKFVRTDEAVSAKRQKIDIEIVDGKLQCVADIGLGGQYAAEFKHEYAKYLDKEHFLKALESMYGVKISQLNFDGINKRGNDVRIKAECNANIQMNDSVIYINPMLIGEITTNPFIADERNVPVEFPFKNESTIVTSIKIPEGYYVDSSPKPMTIKNATGQLSYSYNVSNDNQTVMIICRHKNLSISYPPQEYADIRYIYGVIADKNNELLVLKKK